MEDKEKLYVQWVNNVEHEYEKSNHSLPIEEFLNTRQDLLDKKIKIDNLKVY